MSAWLRKRPATRMPSSRTTNVTTTTKATIATPPQGSAPVFNRMRACESGYDGTRQGPGRIGLWAGRALKRSRPIVGLAYRT